MKFDYDKKLIYRIIKKKFVQPPIYFHFYLSTLLKRNKMLVYFKNYIKIFYACVGVPADVDVGLGCVRSCTPALGADKIRKSGSGKV